VLTGTALAAAVLPPQQQQSGVHIGTVPADAVAVASAGGR